MIGLGQLVDAASKAFSSIGQMPDGLSRRVWQELHPILGLLGRAMSEKWVPHFAQQIPCTLRAHGAPPCPCLSIANCMACGQPVCAYHACVDHSGGAVCFSCVQLAMHARGRAPGAPPPPPPHEAQEAERRRQEEKRRQAYVELGLEPGASFAEVKRAHRRLVKLHHTDKGGDLEKIKRINAAWTLLKGDHEEQGRKVA